MTIGEMAEEKKIFFKIVIGQMAICQITIGQMTTSNL
jgi:hypothetical protein